MHRYHGCYRRIRTSLVVFLTLLLILVNAAAWVQVRAMTHFVPDGPSLESLLAAPLPEQLRVVITGVPVQRPQNNHTPADHYLPFEVRTIPLANDEMLESWYVPHPQPLGVVVMFVGYAGAKEGVLTPAAHMYQFGYSSLLVDFRGAGGSSRNDTTLGMREAEDVAAAVAYTHQQWPDTPIILYGMSMGGASILRAVAHEDVQPTALIVEGVFDRFMTTVRHRFDSFGVPAFPAADLLVFWGNVQTGYNGFTHNPVDYAASVECPALIMYGDRDPWITRAEAEAVAQQVRGPVQLVAFPDVGHTMPYVHPAPDRWVETVRTFLAQIDAPQ